MNVQEYIASGILELYVLGTLSEKERAEVSQYATQYPEIEAEIIRLEGIVVDLAQSRAIPVRADQKEAILQKIDQLNAPPASSNPTTAASSSSPFLSWLLGALAVLGLGAALYFYQQNTTAQNELTATADELADCDSIRTQNLRLNEQFDLLINPATDILLLEREDYNQYATLYRNTAAKRAFLDISKLPAPPSGKQYQLWYIAAGEPQSMGVFDLDSSLVDIDYINNATVFAISLENEGGNPTPTDIRYLAQV